MTTKTYKVLGQSAPAAATPTDLYVVPASSQAVISTLKIANRNPTEAAPYRIAVVPSGESIGTKHYIVYDKFLDPRDDRSLTIGISLRAGDKIVVYGGTADLSFSLFGVEFTNITSTV